MARRRLLAGIITAMCLSGLGRRDGGLGTSAMRWNGRSPNYRNSAFERWTNSEHEVSRRQGGSEFYSPYSSSAFSSNFSSQHYVQDPSTPLHPYSSRSHQSHRRRPQEHSRRRPQHQQPTEAARQNRGIEDQGERAGAGGRMASERSSFIRPSRTILQISKGRSFVHSFVRSLRAVATFRDKIANNIGASPSVL